MTVTLPSTKYPAALTNAAWQKKKSFLDKAKSKTKTGLGAQLVLAETAWGNIKFDLLQASKQVIPTAAAADKAKQAAVTHQKTVVSVASKAIIAAAKSAATSKANAALSTTAKQAAAAIETGLLTQSRRLRDIDLDDFDLAKTHIIQLTGATSFGMIKTGLVKAAEFHSLVEKAPTRANFNDHVQDVCRRLTVPLGTIGPYNGKEDPKDMVTPLGRWADGKDKLPAYKDANEEKTKVREALEKFEDALVGIHHWAA